MTRFWDLLERSTIFGGVIAMGMVGVASYCVITGTEVPEYFALSFGVIIGWFFTSKAKDEAQRQRVG